jgi:hypothetical protein
MPTARNGRKASRLFAGSLIPKTEATIITEEFMGAISLLTSRGRRLLLDGHPGLPIVHSCLTYVGRLGAGGLKYWSFRLRLHFSLSQK